MRFLILVILLWSIPIRAQLVEGIRWPSFRSAYVECRWCLHVTPTHWNHDWLTIITFGPVYVVPYRPFDEML